MQRRQLVQGIREVQTALAESFLLDFALMLHDRLRTRKKGEEEEGEKK